MRHLRFRFVVTCTVAALLTLLGSASALNPGESQPAITSRRYVTYSERDLWEYHRETIPEGMTDAELIRLLNTLGDQGWELILDRDPMLVFKRPIEVVYCPGPEQYYTLDIYDGDERIAEWKVQASYWQRADGVSVRGFDATLTTFRSDILYYEPVLLPEAERLPMWASTFRTALAHFELWGYTDRRPMELVTHERFTDTWYDFRWTEDGERRTVYGGGTKGFSFRLHDQGVCQLVAVR